MSKPLKIVLWIVGIVVVLGLLFVFVARPILIKNTKKHSPEVSQSYSIDELKIDLFYCSPSKKGRKIFGDLVPYDEVWRTGANEASTFTTNKDLLIDGQTLPAGKYSLWTIPGKEEWKIIFNSKMYPWGVRWQDSKAMREAEYDVVVATAKVSNIVNSQEKFSIRIITMPGQPSPTFLLAWDQVVVTVPIEAK